MKKCLFIIALTMALSNCSLPKTLKKKQHSNYSCGCIIMTDINSHYWKTDSIGNRNSRAIISRQINDNCNLIGKSYQKIIGFFGGPNNMRKAGDYYLMKKIKHFSLYYYAISVSDDRNDTLPGTGIFEVSFSLADSTVIGTDIWFTE